MGECFDAKRCPKGYVKSKKLQESCAIAGKRTCSRKREKVGQFVRAPKAKNPTKSRVMKEFHKLMKEDPTQWRGDAMKAAWGAARA